MLPKSSKHYIQPTAEKLGHTETLVSDAVHFFYSNLRKALSELKHYNIQVPNLGSFKVINKEIPKLEKKLSGHLDTIEPTTFNQMSLQKDLEARLNKVHKLQKLIAEERVRRKEFIESKNEQVNHNMEK